MKSKPIRFSVPLSLIFIVVSTPAINSQTCIQDFAPKPPLGFVAFEASYNLTVARHCFRLKDLWSDETITIEDKQSFALPAEGVAFFRFQMQ